MNKETFGIGILSLTGLVLLVANWFAAPVVTADVVKDRDYQVVTARVALGGDALYVLDNRSGVVSVFLYDPGQRRMVPRVARPMSELFPVTAR